MTRLFIRFYLGVLIVFFLAWYIHGAVSKSRVASQFVRVIEEAHRGFARLVVSELDAASADNRGAVLASLQERFDIPIKIVPVEKLPDWQRQRFADGDEIIFFIEDNVGGMLIAPLANTTEAIRFGALPARIDIEASLRGGVRLVAAKLEAEPSDRRESLLKEMSKRFDYPVELVSVEALPIQQQGRVLRGDDVVFYEIDGLAYVATPVGGQREVIRFGAFPNLDRVEQEVMATALALVLLPAALAIAVLLRPVAQQLRRVEHAAKAIADGDLSARVDERRVRSAKTLAEAFNNMAARTESLVRTQSELLQAVSHELRTPLSRMRFAVELVESAKDDKQRTQRLQSLDDALEELDQLVGELLRYVRLETSQPELQRHDLLLQDSLDILVPKHAALYPAIEFATEDTDEPACSVHADEAAFRRALGNLLNNAGRFAKSRVIVRAEPGDEVVIVQVDDDGPGIRESDRIRVLEPFVRLDGNGPGVGLGLALVNRIVTQHGGSVEVLTSPLGGCRIRTTWPQAKGEPDASASG